MSHSVDNLGLLSLLWGWNLDKELLCFGHVATFLKNVIMHLRYNEDRQGGGGRGGGGCCAMWRAMSAECAEHETCLYLAWTQQNPRLTIPHGMPGSTYQKSISRI